MSTRYRYIEKDGDTAAPASALEVAIDQFAIQFLSSSEAESVVNALWRGQLVAVYGEHDNIEFEPYKQDSSASFFDHLSVHRLQVPRYANVSLLWTFVPSAATDRLALPQLFSIATWLFFLFIYSQAVQTPLDSQDEKALSVWEWILYILAISFLIDGK